MGLTTELASSIRTVNGIIGKKAILLDYGCENVAVAERLEELEIISAVSRVDTYTIPLEGWRALVEIPENLPNITSYPFSPAHEAKWNLPFEALTRCSRR